MPWENPWSTSSSSGSYGGSSTSGAYGGGGGPGSYPGTSGAAPTGPQFGLSSLTPEQLQALIAQLRGTDLTQAPEEEQGFLDRIVNPITDVVGKAAEEITTAAVYGTLGLPGMAKNMIQQSIADVSAQPWSLLAGPAAPLWAAAAEELGPGQSALYQGTYKPVVTQTAEDLRHPLRHPGYFALDVLGLYGIGAGALARHGAGMGRLATSRARAAEEAGLATREGLIASESGLTAASDRPLRSLAAVEDALLAAAEEAAAMGPQPGTVALPNLADVIAPTRPDPAPPVPAAAPVVQEVVAAPEPMTPIEAAVSEITPQVRDPLSQIKEVESGAATVEDVLAQADADRARLAEALAPAAELADPTELGGLLAAAQKVADEAPVALGDDMLASQLAEASAEVDRLQVLLDETPAGHPQEVVVGKDLQRARLREEDLLAQSSRPTTGYGEMAQRSLLEARELELASREVGLRRGEFPLQKGQDPIQAGDYASQVGRAAAEAQELARAAGAVETGLPEGFVAGMKGTHERLMRALSPEPRKGKRQPMDVTGQVIGDLGGEGALEATLTVSQAAARAAQGITGKLDINPEQFIEYARGLKKGEQRNQELRQVYGLEEAKTVADRLRKVGGYPISRKQIADEAAAAGEAVEDLTNASFKAEPIENASGSFRILADGEDTGVGIRHAGLVETGPARDTWQITHNGQPVGPKITSTTAGQQRFQHGAKLVPHTKGIRNAYEQAVIYAKEVHAGIPPEVTSLNSGRELLAKLEDGRILPMQEALDISRELGAKLEAESQARKKSDIAEEARAEAGRREVEAPGEGFEYLDEEQMEARALEEAESATSRERLPIDKIDKRKLEIADGLETMLGEPIEMTLALEDEAMHLQGVIEASLEAGEKVPKAQRQRLTELQKSLVGPEDWKLAKEKAGPEERLVMDQISAIQEQATRMRLEEMGVSAGPKGRRVQSTAADVEALGATPGRRPPRPGSPQYPSGAVVEGPLEGGTKVGGLQQMSPAILSKEMLEAVGVPAGISERLTTKIRKALMEELPELGRDLNAIELERVFNASGLEIGMSFRLSHDVANAAKAARSATPAPAPGPRGGVLRDPGKPKDREPALSPDDPTGGVVETPKAKKPREKKARPGKIELVATLPDGTTRTLLVDKMPQHWHSRMMQEFPYGMDTQGATFTRRRVPEGETPVVDTSSHGQPRQLQPGGVRKRDVEKAGTPAGAAQAVAKEIRDVMEEQQSSRGTPHTVEEIAAIAEAAGMERTAAAQLAKNVMKESAPKLEKIPGSLGGVLDDLGIDPADQVPIKEGVSRVSKEHAESGNLGSELKAVLDGLDAKYGVGKGDEAFRRLYRYAGGASTLLMAIGPAMTALLAGADVGMAGMFAARLAKPSRPVTRGGELTFGYFAGEYLRGFMIGPQPETRLLTRMEEHRVEGEIDPKTGQRGKTTVEELETATPFNISTSPVKGPVQKWWMDMLQTAYNQHQTHPDPGWWKKTGTNFLNAKIDRQQAAVKRLTGPLELRHREEDYRAQRDQAWKRLLDTGNFEQFEIDIARSITGDILSPQVLKAQADAARAGPGRVGRFMDSANQLAALTLLFLKPGYIPPNVVGQLIFMTIDHAFNPFAMSNNVALQHKMYRKYPALREQINLAMNAGPMEALMIDKGMRGPVGRTISRAHKALATKTSRVIDNPKEIPFRDITFLNAASKRGYYTPEQIKQLVEARSGKLKQDRDLIVVEANRNIVDYGNMSEMERNSIRRVILFYPWIKGATWYGGRFLTEHPVQAGIHGYAGREFEEQVDDVLGEVPSYMKGVFPMPEFLSKIPGMGPAKRNIPGVGEVSRIINPAAFTPFGPAAGALQTARGLIFGQTLPSASLAQYANPLVSAGVGMALRIDPFTGEKFAPEVSGLDILQQEMIQTVPALPIANAAAAAAGLDLGDSLLFPQSKSQKIEEGIIDPAETLLPTTRADEIGKFFGGIYGQTYNPVEGQSRAFAEKVSLTEKVKQVRVKWQDKIRRTTEDAQRAGVLKPGEQMPKALRDAIILKQERLVGYTQLALARGTSESNLTAIDRLESDLGLLVRSKKMGNDQAKELLTAYVQLDDDAINYVRRQLGEGFFGDALISAYKSAWVQAGVTEMSYDLR